MESLVESNIIIVHQIGRNLLEIGNEIQNFRNGTVLNSEILLDASSGGLRVLLILADLSYFMDNLIFLVLAMLLHIP